MTSIADALSGRWAANISGWVATTALASGVVVAQEVATPLPHVGWILASMLAQTVASTLWAAAVAAISRRRFRRVVPLASGVLWIGIGVTRGIAGGLVASAAGAEPEWAYRIGFWTLASLCWMPLVTYALAQWDAHRRLLAVRVDLAEAYDAAAARAAESVDERSRRMAQAVDDSLRPALDEIREALREASTLDESEAAAIAGRLDELARRTAGFTASVPLSVAPRPSERVSVNRAANEFELRRPVFAALLAAAETAPIVLPEAYRNGGWPDVPESAFAILVSATALVILYRVVGRFLPPGATRSVVTRVGVFVAGLAGAAVTLVLPWDVFGPDDHVVTAGFPFIFWFAAAATGTAVAFRATNVDLATHVTADRAAYTELATRVAEADREASGRLETLVRGEINGRVASCALALGMLVDDGVPPAARQRMIASVLKQLDAAADDLRAP